MKLARWGVSLPFATKGGNAYGTIAAHVFTDDSITPICLPLEAGAPGSLSGSERAWHCQECQSRVVRAWWSVTSFAKERLWAADAHTLMAAWARGPGPLRLEHRAPPATGIAANDVQAFEQARDAISKLLPADAPVIFTRNSDAKAEEVARERRAVARSKNISDGTGAQVVQYVYRHHKHYPSWFAADFEWKTEAAKVLRKTAKRLFVQDTLGTYTTDGGVMVLKCHALDRAALEKGTHRWGWTLNPHPPADGRGSAPGWAEVLGLKLPCTFAQAKRAFRTAAKAAHPDAGGSPEAFRKVTAAYSAASQHFGVTS